MAEISNTVPDGKLRFPSKGTKVLANFHDTGRLCNGC